MNRYWVWVLMLVTSKSLAEDSMTQRFLTKLGPDRYQIRIGDDNDDKSLGRLFRAWWYVALDDATPGHLTRISVTRRGHKGLYLPVYSYDQKTWQSFSQTEILRTGTFSFQIKKSFEAQKVYLARAEPYSYQRLMSYLEDLKTHPSVYLTFPARSKMGYAFPFLTLTDIQSGPVPRKRLWIQARTHPGETATSFVLEGFIKEVLANPLWQKALRHSIISIVPMHNVDGVIKGNQRVSPRGFNLEESWFYTKQNPDRLTPESPFENKLIGAIFKDFQKGPHKISLALNLHSTNGSPYLPPHFLPHFGDKPRFSKSERALFKNQKLLSLGFYEHMGFGNLPHYFPANHLFLTKDYFETWIWREYQDKITAVTFEATYGYVPKTKNFHTSKDHRAQGEALAQAVLDWLQKDPNLAQLPMAH